MTKKEFSEIKKTLTTANTGFRRMFASYIPLDGDPVKLNTSGFLAKSEDEVELYFELFKKTLSGTIGKQLVMADFNNSSEEDGMQSKLYGVLKSRDDDTGSVDSITATFAESYHLDTPYILFIMQAAYDAYDKNTDESTTFDHLIGMVCPVDQEKSMLEFGGDYKVSFSGGRKTLKKPEFGFLFPAFNDRTMDIHQIAMYSKKYTNMERSRLMEIFDCRLPLPKEEQQQIFSQLAESAFGGKCNFNEASYVQSSLLERLNDEETTIGMQQLKDVFESAGATEFNEEYDENEQLLEGHDINIDNLINKKKVTIEAGDMTITAYPDMIPNIQVRELDGRKVIVSEPRENISLNGLETAEAAK